MASQPGFVYGRKRRNNIWKNLHYVAVEKKTECVVEKDGEKCGHKITGKKRDLFYLNICVGTSKMFGW